MIGTATKMVRDTAMFAGAQMRCGALRRARTLAAVVLCTCASIGAAKAQPITLEGAIRGALRSDNILIQQQDENVKGAAAGVQQAAGTFDWNVSAQGGWQELYVPKPVNGVLTDQTATVGSYYYSANIGREFRNGITVAPGITAYPGAGASPAQTAGLTELRPSLGLKIPLLRGLGEESADAGERAAKDVLRSTRLSRTFAIAQVVGSVVQTFWRCLADEQVAQISKDADRNALGYEDTLHKMVQKGLLEPTVAQQWSANQVTRHLDVQRTADAVQLCLRDLAYATTGDLNDPSPIPSGELPRVDDLKNAVDRLNAAVLVQVALDSRRDFQAAKQNVEAAIERLKSARSSTSPELDLHIEPESAIVSYSQSIQNNAAEGQEAAAQAARNQAQLVLQQLQNQITMDVADTVHSLQQTALDWGSLDAAERQMESVVHDANRRAQYGSIDWSAFLGAQDQMVQLQRQVLNTRLQFAIGLATLRLATGTVELDASTPATIATTFATLPAR